MKKIIVGLFLLILSSCSNKIDQDLIGTWEHHDDTHILIEFFEEKNQVNLMEYDNESVILVEKSGEVKENKIIFHEIFYRNLSQMLSEKEEYDIKIINENMLTLIDQEKNQIDFTKKGLRN